MKEVKQYTVTTTGDRQIVEAHSIEVAIHNYERDTKHFEDEITGVVLFDESSVKSLDASTTQCYIPVDVSSGELPDVDPQYHSLSITVIVMDKDENVGSGYYLFDEKCWDCGRISTPTHWLKLSTTPVVQGYSEEVLEALKQIAQMSDSGNPLTTVINMKRIASDFLSSINKQH